MLTLLALLAGQPAVAQDRMPGGVEAHGFKLAPGDGEITDYLATWNARTLPKGQFAALGLIEYSHAPFLTEDRVLDPGYANFHLGAAYGIIDRVGVAVHLPTHWVDTNDSAALVLGDLRFAVPVSILGEGAEGFALSAVPFATMPTGPTHRFLGNKTVTGGAMVAAGYGLEKFRFDGNLGVQTAPTIDDPDLRGGGRMLAAVGGAYSFSETFALRLEYMQTVGLAAGTGPENPGELLVSGRGRYDNGLGWTAGAAAGVVPGMSRAQFRLFAGLGWNMRPPEPPPVIEPPAPPPPPAELQLGLGAVDSFGNPVSGVPVFLEDRQVGSTDATGKIVLDDIPGGTTGELELRPERATGLGPMSVPFTMPDDGTLDLQAELEWLPGAVKVRARDEEGNPVSTAKVSFLGPEEEIENLPIGADGEKLFVVDPGIWTLLVMAPTFGSERFDLDISPDEKVLVVIEVVLEPAEVEITQEEVKILKKIFFDFDSDKIKDESMELVSEVAATMLEHKELLKVEVQGHTDNRGKAAYNKDLSQRRVNAVVEALVRMGVARDRLVPKGYGPDKPIDTNETDAGRAKNRRVQFIILERAEP
ncbi:MAG: hypothetical protein EA397_16135 [Deltaproteobacteria bacterium]|nr:MAG: hypothetical protein EA397_16135 [Deltaproteobacteria bacterium]